MAMPADLEPLAAAPSTNRRVVVSAVIFVFCVSTLATLGSAGCGRGVWPQSPPTERALTAPYPPTQSVGGTSAMTCLALMETDLTASPDRALTNGIEGRVTPGRNGISLMIKDASTLTFVSGQRA